MTIDYKDLEIGDTVEHQNGGKSLMGYIHRIYSGSVITCISTNIGTFFEGGRYSDSKEIHPFDIVAIHKKPQPRVYEFLMCHSSCPLWCANLTVRMTDQLNGEVTAEVVK